MPGTMVVGKIPFHFSAATRVGRLGLLRRASPRAWIAPASALPVTITFGGAGVTPDFAGLSATGLYQFNIKVPDSAPNGDNLVVATINGISTQSNAFMTVQR